MEVEVIRVDLRVERCAGLDVGKREVVVCVRVAGQAGQRQAMTRTFSTFTSSLEAMASWLASQRVTHGVMEATGQYWKPVWYVLEERGFELMLVNARHVRILPGRKTDGSDAAWLAELLEHGLLRGSFVPPPAIRQLRDLTRYRKKLTEQHTAETQRIIKTLEDAGDHAGLGGLRRARGLRAGDAGSAARRGTRSPGAGPAGEGAAAP